MSARILVIEDDLATSRMVLMALKSAGHQAEAARSFRAAKEQLEKGRHDLLLCDLYLGDGTGLDVLKLNRTSAQPAPVIMFTAQGTVETAVQAIDEGAFDYLAKPFQVKELLALVERALESRQKTEEDETGDEGPESILVGTSPPMVELYKKIALAARSDSPVLITGETGTGKELVARCLHRFSARRDRPFLPVNCGALTETLLESELFGHERGAFTGAVTTRKGLLEQAQGGTLFLDEITETTPAFQVKLLRFLQEGELRPVGGSRNIRIDVRVIAASNREIDEVLQKNEFRRDLYYRLGVVELVIPPLRQRRSDSPQLVRHFLKGLEGKLGREIRLTAGAIQALHDYDWPGNVRELENVIERIAVLKTDRTIQAEDLTFLKASSDPEVSDTSDLDLNELDRAEREKILQVLEECAGNRTEAARRLGIERKSLYRKAKRLGIDLNVSY